MKIILASNSPRRSQLLQQAEVDFSILVSHTDEYYPEDMTMEAVPVFLARKKAIAVWEQLDASRKKESVVIAADTVVILDGRIIGKPQDAEDAEKMLKLLSGRMHWVVTGVVLQSLTQQVVICEETEVWFRVLTSDQIRYYVDKYKPFDKAGAYAIQEWIGVVGVEKIKGDYYNVMGLPVNKVVAALKGTLAVSCFINEVRVLQPERLSCEAAFGGRHSTFIPFRNGTTVWNALFI